MRTIAAVQLDKRRPALILRRQSQLHLLTWITLAPITSTIRGITSEVLVRPRNGLDHDSVVSCDNIVTTLARAIGDAFDLSLA